MERVLGSIVFLNQRSELGKLRDFAYGVFEACNVPRQDYVKLRSGLDEALTNCILYAYDTPGKEIRLEAVADGSTLTFTITDSGKPFDPVSYVCPDNGELKIGGLGIIMMKNIFRRMSYRRENDQNILELMI